MLPKSLLPWLQHCSAVTWLVPRETAAVSAHTLCTPYNHGPVYSVILFEATWNCCCLGTHSVYTMDQFTVSLYWKPHETAAVLAHTLCTPYNHGPVYSVTLFEATWNCCCLSTHCVYTLQPCSSLQCQFIWSHMKLYIVCIPYNHTPVYSVTLFEATSLFKVFQT